MFSPNPNGPKIHGRSFDPSVHKIPSIASCHDLRAMVPQIFLDLSWPDVDSMKPSNRILIFTMKLNNVGAPNVDSPLKSPLDHNFPQSQDLRPLAICRGGANRYGSTSRNGIWRPCFGCFCTSHSKTPSTSISSFWEDLCPTDSKNKKEKGRCRTLREQDMGLLTRKPREEFGHLRRRFERKFWKENTTMVPHHTMSNVPWWFYPTYPTAIPSTSTTSGTAKGFHSDLTRGNQFILFQRSGVGALQKKKTTHGAEALTKWDIQDHPSTCANVPITLSWRICFSWKPWIYLLKIS